MSEESIGASLAALRRAFDESFARVPEISGEAVLDLVMLRAGERLVVVDLCDIRRIVRCPQITPLPSAQTGMLGLAGAEGVLIAVYSLALLVGASEAGGGAWLFTCSFEPRLALRFDGIEAHRRVARTKIAPVSASSGREPVVDMGGQSYPLTSVPRLLCGFDDKEIQ